MNYEPLAFVETITATKTDDQALAAEPRGTYTPEELIAYLRESPRHAVVIHDLEEESGECVALSPTYILRDAGEEGYFYGPYPAEDPGDATPADDAVRALSEALDLLCTG